VKKLEADETAISVINNPVFNEAGRVKVTPPPLLMFTTTSTTEAPYVHNLKHVLHLSLLFFEAQRSGKLPMDNRVQWRKGSDYLKSETRVRNFLITNFFIILDKIVGCFMDLITKWIS